jgi:hypothetical protein
MGLLTTREAAAYLKVDRHVLPTMPIPHVMLGKRKRRYRTQDLDNFVQGRILYPQGARPHERRIQGRPQTLGISHLPTWQEAETLSLANQKGGPRCL